MFLELKIQFTHVSKQLNTAPVVAYYTHAREQNTKPFLYNNKTFLSPNFPPKFFKNMETRIGEYIL